MRFIVDQTQTPNLKVKVAILRYIQALARLMDPAHFVNSSETRLAVSRIITWTTEPKSSDVRKVRWGFQSKLLLLSSIFLHLFFFFAAFLILVLPPTTHLDPAQLGGGGCVGPNQHHGLSARGGPPGGQVQAGSRCLQRAVWAVGALTLTPNS